MLRTFGLMAMIWTSFAILGGILDGADFTGDDRAIANTLIQADQLNQPVSDTSNAELHVPTLTSWSAWYNMLTWNFDFLTEGNAQYVRWLIFLPISAMIYLGFFISFLGLVRLR